MNPMVTNYMHGAGGAVGAVVADNPGQAYIDATRPQNVLGGELLYKALLPLAQQMERHYRTVASGMNDAAGVRAADFTETANTAKRYGFKPPTPDMRGWPRRFTPDKYFEEAGRLREAQLRVLENMGMHRDEIPTVKDGMQHMVNTARQHASGVGVPRLVAGTALNAARVFAPLQAVAGAAEGTVQGFNTPTEEYQQRTGIQNPLAARAAGVMQDVGNATTFGAADKLGRLINRGVNLYGDK